MDIEDPPEVEAARNIPENLLHKLLDPTGSIGDLLCFSVPSLDSSLSSFQFSHDIPTNNVEELLSRSVPPYSQLTALDQELPNTVKHGMRSFFDGRYNNSPTPLFMVSFWLAQAHAITEKRRWQQCEEWLLALCCSPCRTTASTAERAILTFYELSWDVYLEGPNGHSPGIYSADLQPLLSHSMLSSSLIDAMIAGIQSQQSALLPLDSTSQPRAEVKDLTSFHVLRKPQEDWENYHTARQFCALRDLGNRLAQDEVDVVYLPAHVRGNHWVVFVVDANAREIRYGDSLGMPPSGADIFVIQQWLELHKLGCFDLGEELTIGTQPAEDGFSCGILAINAVRHALFADALWTPPMRDVTRINEYLRLVDNHLQVAAKVRLSVEYI